MGTHKTIFIRKEDGSVIKRRIYVSSNVKVRRNLYKRLDEQYGAGNWGTKSFKKREPREDLEPKPEWAKNVKNYEELSSEAVRRLKEEKGAIPKSPPGVRRETYRERLERMGIIRKTGTWKEQLPPRTVQAIEEGRLKLPEGTVVHKGVLITPGAQRGLQKKADIEWMQEYKKTWEEKRKARTKKDFVTQTREEAVIPRKKSFQETIEPKTTVPPMDIGGKMPPGEYQQTKRQKSIITRLYDFSQESEVKALRASGVKKQLHSMAAMGSSFAAAVLAPVRHPVQSIYAMTEKESYTHFMGRLKRREVGVMGDLGAMYFFSKAGGKMVRPVVKLFKKEPKIKQTSSRTSTKRVMTDEVTQDISKYTGRAQVGEKAYRVKGTTGEIFYPKDKALASKIATKLEVTEIPTKKGAPPEVIKAYGRGTSETVKVKRRSVKDQVVETLYDKGKEKETVLTRDIIETEPAKPEPTVIKETQIDTTRQFVGGKKVRSPPGPKAFTMQEAYIKTSTRDFYKVQAEYLQTMKGTEFSFSYGTAKGVKGRGPVHKATKPELVQSGRFVSRRVGEIQTGERVTQFWVTEAKGKAPGVPKGAKVTPLDKGGVVITDVSHPMVKMLKSKKASSRGKLKLQEPTVKITKTKTSEIARIPVSEQYYKSLVKEIFRGMDKGKAKQRFIPIAKAKPGFKPGTLQPAKSKIKLLPGAAAKTQPTIKAKPVSVIKTMQEPFPITREESLIKAKVAQESIQKPMQRSAQVVALDTVQEVKPTVKQKTAIAKAKAAPVPAPPKPVFPKPPPAPDFRKKEPGYNVYMYEEGKKVKANIKPLPKKEADRLGRDIADHSLSASYSVSKTSVKVPGARRSKLQTGGIVSPSKFRPGKSSKTKKFNVEHRRHRLDTPGEVGGISAAKLIKMRKGKIKEESKGSIYGKGKGLISGVFSFRSKKTRRF